MTSATDVPVLNATRVAIKLARWEPHVDADRFVARMEARPTETFRCRHITSFFRIWRRAGFLLGQQNFRTSVSFKAFPWIGWISTAGRESGLWRLLIALTLRPTGPSVLWRWASLALTRSGFEFDARVFLAIVRSGKRCMYFYLSPQW